MRMTKGYPRVSKAELRRLLRNYGSSRKCLEIWIGLHECTDYKARGNRVCVKRGRLRGGCIRVTQPPLSCFHVYRQSAMRKAEARWHEQYGDVGIPWRGVPLGSFVGANVWKRRGRKCKTVRMSGSFSVDDTLSVG